jgi:uncharacterized LabA/DUF88 family protein
MIGAVSSPNSRVAAYIDGFNLYYGMHDARGRRGLWLDLESLLGSMIAPTQHLVAVHYFTALVTGPGQARQQAYLDALRVHSRVTVAHVGRFQRKPQTCRGCGAQWNIYEVKDSDVCFGVQLVADAASDVFDEALLITGDSDMLPAVRAARRLAPAARMVAVFPPRRSSQALLDAVDARLQIFDRLPERHQLPDPVPAPDGSTYARPAHWR